MRGYRDHDHIKTTDDMIFTVIGNVHPPNRVIAYLKYILSSRKARFERILKHYTMRDIEYTLHYLSKTSPHHLFHDDTLYFQFSAPLISNIKEHFKPEDRLTQIINSGKDKLERTTKELVFLLSEHSGVSLDNFGVTGSILLGIHNLHYSDIDLTVYGRDASTKVLKTMREWKNTNHGSIKGFSLKDLTKLYSERGIDTNLTFDEYTKIYRRLLNRGYYRERFFSIHPVKLESEVEERYGTRRYKRLGEVEAEAIVTDVEDSIFYPAIYRLENSTITNGVKVENIEEIICYEGLYCGILSPGERIRVKGVVEEVSTKERKWFRIVTGSLGGSSFIKILSHL